MKTVVIYHSIDLDGWMSAAIVKHWFNKRKKNYVNSKVFKEVDVDFGTLHFIGYNYGQPIPDLSEYDKVIMCDISFPIEEMFKLFNKLKDNFVVIDHHISFIKSNVGAQNKIKNYNKEVENKKEQEIIYVDNEWNPVKGYEGLYEVSNNGQIRSLDRIIEASDGKEYNRKGKILKPYFSKRGYYVVNLPKGQVGIHKLVAEAFIPNIENLSCINHIDGNTKNNVITNLEWCSYSKNNQHALDNNMRIPNNKAVVQLDLENNYIKWYYSLADAERETGIAWTNISSVCRENGISKTAGRFKWKFVEDYNKDKFEGIRDTKFAACELTWKYFFPNEQMPEIVRLLGLYDSFRHKNTDEETKVLEFQYGARQCISNYEEAYKYLTIELNSYLPNPNNYDREENPIYKIWNNGKSIYQYLCTEAKQTYKNGFDIKLYYNDNMKGNTIFGEFKFICINKERFNPINFGIDYHKDGYDGVACFHYANGMWNFSIYNDNGLVDCSIIAKQYLGGGHAGASGFKLNNEQFNNLISSGRAL